MKLSSPVVLLMSLFAALLMTSTVTAAEPKLIDEYIFLHSKAKNKKGKEVTIFYRISSIVTANDGTIVALCNGRVGSTRDNCPYQTIVLRRSESFSTSTHAPRPKTQAAIGQPDNHADGRPKHVGHNQVVYSDDHGKTWIAGEYVSPKTGEGRDMPGGTVIAVRTDDITVMLVGSRLGQLSSRRPETTFHLQKDHLVVRLQ